MADKSLSEFEKDLKRTDYEVDVICLKRVVRTGVDISSDVIFYDGHVNHVDGCFYLGEWGQKRTSNNGLFTSFNDLAEAVEKSVRRGLEDLVDKRRLADLQIRYESCPEKYGLAGSRGSTDPEGSYLLRALNDPEMEELISKVDARIRKLYPENI